jgi:hypothetical protein
MSEMEQDKADLGTVWDALQADASYDAFGNLIDEEYSPTECDAMFEFSGRDSQSDAELHVYRPRWADPTSGTWLKPSKGVRRL